MAARLLHLLSLVALMLMPLGMAAPAAAHSAPAAMSDHCDGQQDQGSPDSPAELHMDCAICSALPASAPAHGGDLALHPLVLTPGVAVAFVGIEPATATPPPKQA